MSVNKTYKKGEFIYKEGEKVQGFVFIQSGGVSQCLVKGKKTIDLFQLSNNQFLGDSALLGQMTHNHSAVCTAETKTLEVPVEMVKSQYDIAPQFIKLIIRSLAERLKMSFNEIRSAKLEKDSGPCPDEMIAPTFGALFHTLKHKSEKTKEGFSEITWNLLRQYGQRILGQSPKRLEQALNILVKLKQAHLIMGHAPENPDGPEEIQSVVVYDLDLLESFFEYFQYYFYKPGKIDFLKYDELISQIVEVMIQQAGSSTPDRFGVVSIDFNKFTDVLKSDVGINFSADHITRLENKGVMTKRQAHSQGLVKLDFEIKAVKHTFYCWKILKEIEKWNEKGFVDLNEKDEKKKKSTENGCPHCGSPTQPQQKFCGECGYNLSAKAAS